MRGRQPLCTTPPSSRRRCVRHSKNERFASAAALVRRVEPVADVLVSRLRASGPKRPHRSKHRRDRGEPCFVKSPQSLKLKDGALKHFSSEEEAVAYVDSVTGGER